MGGTLSGHHKVASQDGGWWGHDQSVKSSELLDVSSRASITLSGWFQCPHSRSVSAFLLYF